MTITSPTPQIDLLRMPFDQYGRYKIIAEVADALRAALAVPRLRILDIGGYQVDERFGERLPLTLFLPHDEIAALDTVASELPGYYQGDGTALEFGDGSFDLVVSADTLEHIPADSRQQFVRELARVSQHGVALVAPFFSNETELAETVLYRYMATELRYKHPFLQEHRDYGLPHVDETEQWLAAMSYTTATFPSGYVHSWLEMMVLRTLLWRLTSDDSLVGALEEYYNRVLFPVERREPAYRHLIVAAPSTAPLLVQVAQQALAASIHAASTPPSNTDQFLQQFLLQLMPMGILDRMRGEEESTVTYWREAAHRWEVEANRVEQERQQLEREWQAAVRDRQHWEAEANRVEQERQQLERERQHWETEANRVELERQALEQERASRQQQAEQLGQLSAERDQWRKLAQRPLLVQLLARLRSFKA